jgi:tetratricopeptide (TPR) repeat protein
VGRPYLPSHSFFLPQLQIFPRLYDGCAMQLRTVSALLLLIPCPALATPQAAPSKAAEIRQHTQLAQQYLMEKRPDLALPEFRTLATVEPQNADVQGNLGVLLYFRGDYQQAIPHLRAAIHLRPGLPKIQALLGLAEQRSSETSAAITDLRTAFPLLEEPKIKREVGGVLIADYARSGDPQDALAVTGTLLKDDPTNVNLLYTEYRLGSDIADQAILTLALAAPESAQMHQAMAHELYRHDDTPAAIANYRKALAMDPNLPGLHFELAELLENSNDPTLQKQAEAEYKLALKENPDNEKAWVRMGDILARQGDTTGASADYQKALALDPTDDDAMVDQANLLLASNHPNEAERLLKQAIATDPTNYSAHYRLSALYRRQGNVDGAKSELAEYQKYKAMKEKLEKLFDQMRLANRNLPTDRVTGEVGNGKN